MCNKREKINLEQHPCFNKNVKHKFGRIHLAVAPKCNISCNYCDRKYDCVNESRPGVSSTVLRPKQAFNYLKEMITRDPRIKVVGIAGPGDPFANPDETMETLRLVRQTFPDIIICLSTNGLNLSPYIDELDRLRVSHVTVTVNSIDPEVSSRIYAWVRDGKKIFRGVEGAKVLLQRQLEGIRLLKERDIIVKVNTIVISGINDDSLDDLVKKMVELKVDLLNCIPIFPNKNSEFGEVTPPSAEKIQAIRSEAGKFIPQMTHCTRCRADAVGCLGEPLKEETIQLMRDCESGVITGQERSRVAIATQEGVLVNQHLGEAIQFEIYEKNEDGFGLLEKRAAPEKGLGDERWKKLARLLQDCKAVLVNGAGERPRQILDDEGLKVTLMEGLIDECLDAVYRGAHIPKLSKDWLGCGAGCSGSGGGCS